MFNFFKKHKKSLLSFAILICVLVIPAATNALSLKDALKPSDSKTADPLDTVAGGANYNVQTKDGTNDLTAYIGMFIQILLSILGVFFLCLMLYGGFLWMSDMGNSDKVKKSKELMTAAVIGLIIVLASYALSYFVIESLSTKTLKNTSSVSVVLV